MFPVIDVAGSPYDRGHAYGSAASARIRSIDRVLRRLLPRRGRLGLDPVDREAARYLSAIKDFSPCCARGAAWASPMARRRDHRHPRDQHPHRGDERRADAVLGQPRAPAECSAFAAVAGNGHVVAGQNWDWAPFALDTVVVLRAEPDDGPAFVTVVEAGLLAKFGANSDRRGSDDQRSDLQRRRRRGRAVPYHVRAARVVRLRQHPGGPRPAAQL